MKGFEKEMEKQRERARASHKFDVAAKIGGANKLDIKATEFVGYTCLDRKAKVIKILVDGKEVNEIKAGRRRVLYWIPPHFTEKWAASWGQGEITGGTGVFKVTDTTIYRRISLYIKVILPKAL